MRYPLTRSWLVCLSNKSPESIRFASLLSYTPKSRWDDLNMPQELLDELKTGHAYMLALKRNCNQPNGSSSIYDSIAKWCSDRDLFPDFFSKETILVPVPGSTLTKPDTLWVPKLLAEALTKHGLGSDVVTCLSRISPIPKSAHSKPEDRATPSKHTASMNIERMITDPKSVLLIDDLVTKGSTFLGATWKMTEMYPDASIKAFAAMGTVSNINDFTKVMNPQEGTIRITETGHSQRIIDQ